MSNENKKLSMQLPSGFAEAVSRRHNGNPNITVDQVIEKRVEMQLLWKSYQREYQKLEYCENEWWDKMEVERHFKRSRWYYAHQKRKKLMAKVEALHKAIFYLLVRTDGNSETFSKHHSLDAQSCYEDFMEKYLIKNNQ